MARTTLNNYLLPRQANSIAARAHHHPTWATVARIFLMDTTALHLLNVQNNLPHYLLDMSIVISQDDKAKIGLGIPAVGRTFHTLQSVNEPINVADHDFPAKS